MSPKTDDLSGSVFSKAGSMMGQNLDAMSVLLSVYAL
jgi:hypothetical protein